MILKVFYFHIYLFQQVLGINYQNYTLFRITPKSDEDLEYVNKLYERFNVTYWSEPSVRIFRHVDFSIGPVGKELLLKEANREKMILNVTLDDIQTAFNNQIIKKYISGKLETFGWDNYYTFKDIYEWMNDMKSTRPDDIKVFSIGKSAEGRDIKCLSINFADKNRSKPRIIIEGGIHGREWISPAVVTYLINTISSGLQSYDSELKRITEEFEWYFIPVVNPDGYVYTHEKDRLWNKNRRKEGVDLNRNFDAKFGTYGCHNSKRHQSYCGKSAFSEPETAALAKFIKQKSNHLKFYFSFHAYGQSIIVPYDYTEQYLDNYETVKALSSQGIKAMNQYGRLYTGGTTYTALGYLSSGSSTCWVKKTFHVPVVLTILLRDEGKFGHALPSSQIMDTCREVRDGLVTMVGPKGTAVLEELESLEESAAGGIETCFWGFFICLLLEFLFN